MNSMPVIPSACVRPPWPDELPRLADTWPGLVFSQPLFLRVLAVPATATSHERLVGVAALAAPTEGKTDATLLFALRPRFADADCALALLNEILAVTSENAFPSLITTAPPATDPRAKLLRAAGFDAVPETNVWRLLPAQKPNAVK